MASIIISDIEIQRVRQGVAKELDVDQAEIDLVVVRGVLTEIAKTTGDPSTLSDQDLLQVSKDALQAIRNGGHYLFQPGNQMRNRVVVATLRVIHRQVTGDGRNPFTDLDLLLKIIQDGQIAIPELSGGDGPVAPTNNDPRPTIHDPQPASGEPPTVTTADVLQGIQDLLEVTGQTTPDLSAITARLQQDQAQMGDPALARQTLATMAYVVNILKQDHFDDVSFDLDDTVIQQSARLNRNLAPGVMYALWVISRKQYWLAPNQMQFQMEYSPTLLAIQTAAFIAKNYQELTKETPNPQQIKPLLLYTNAYPQKLAEIFNANPMLRVLYMGLEYVDRRVTPQDVERAQNILNKKDQLDAQSVFLEQMEKKISKVGLYGLTEAERFAYADLVLHGTHATKHEVVLAYAKKIAFLKQPGSSHHPGVYKDLLHVDNKPQHGMRYLLQTPGLEPESRVTRNPMPSRSRLTTLERVTQMSEPAIIAAIKQAIEAKAHGGEVPIQVVQTPRVFEETPYRPEDGHTRAGDQRVRLRIRYLISQYALPKDKLAQLAQKLRRQAIKKGYYRELKKIYAHHVTRREEGVVEHPFLTMDPSRLDYLQQNGWRVFDRAAIQGLPQHTTANQDFILSVERYLPELIMALSVANGLRDDLPIVFNSTNPTHVIIANALQAATLVLAAEANDLAGLLVTHPDLFNQLRGDLDRAMQLCDGLYGSEYLVNFFSRMRDELIETLPPDFRRSPVGLYARRLTRPLPQVPPDPVEGLDVHWPRNTGMTDHLSPALQMQVFGPRRAVTTTLELKDRVRLFEVIVREFPNMMARINVLDPGPAFDYLKQRITGQSSEAIHRYIDAALNGEDNDLRQIVDGLVAYTLIYRANALMVRGGALDLDHDYYALRYSLVRAEQAMQRIRAELKPTTFFRRGNSPQNLEACMTALHDVKEVLSFLYKQRYDRTERLLDEDWSRLEEMPRSWHLTYWNPNGRRNRFDDIPEGYPRAPLVPEEEAQDETPVRQPGRVARAARAVGDSVLGMGWAEQAISRMEQARWEGLLAANQQLYNGSDVPEPFRTLQNYKQYLTSITSRDGNPFQEALLLYSQVVFAQYTVRHGTLAGVRDTSFNRPVELYYQIITQINPDQARGTILIAPDESLTMAEYFDLARSLLAQNFNIVLYDPRGQGLSTILPQDVLGRPYRVPGTLDSFASLEGDLERVARLAHERLNGPLAVYAHGRSAETLFSLMSRHHDNVAGISAVFLDNPWPHRNPDHERLAGQVVEDIPGVGAAFMRFYQTTRLSQSPAPASESVWSQYGWNMPRHGLALAERMANAKEVRDDVAHGRRFGIENGMTLLRHQEEGAPPTWGREFLTGEHRPSVAQAMGLEVETEERAVANSDRWGRVTRYFAQAVDGQTELDVAEHPTYLAFKANRSVRDKGNAGDVMSSVLIRLLHRYRRNLVTALGNGVLGVAQRISRPLLRLLIQRPGMRALDFLDEVSKAIEDLMIRGPDRRSILYTARDIRDALADELADMTPALSRGWHRTAEFKDWTMEQLCCLITLHPALLDPVMGEAPEVEQTPLSEMVDRIRHFETPPLPPTFDGLQQSYEQINRNHIEDLEQVGQGVEVLWNQDHHNNLEALFASYRSMRITVGFVNRHDLRAPAALQVPMTFAKIASLHANQPRGLPVPVTTDKQARQILAESILEAVIFTPRPELRQSLEEYLWPVASAREGREAIKQYQERLFGVVDYLDSLQAYTMAVSRDEEYRATQSIPPQEWGASVDINDYVGEKQRVYRDDLAARGLDTHALIALLDRRKEGVTDAEIPPIQRAVNPFNLYQQGILGRRQHLQEIFRGLYDQEQSDRLESFGHVAKAEEDFRRAVFTNETIQRTLLHGEYYATPEERQAHRFQLIDMMERFQIVFTYHHYLGLLVRAHAGEVPYEEADQAKATLTRLIFNYVNALIVHDYNHYRLHRDRDPQGLARNLWEPQMRRLYQEQLKLMAWNELMNKLTFNDPTDARFLFNELGSLQERLDMDLGKIHFLGRDNGALQEVWAAHDAHEAAIKRDQEIVHQHVLRHAQARLDFVEPEKKSGIEEMRVELAYQTAYYQLLINKALEQYMMRPDGVPKFPDPQTMSRVNEAYAEYSKAMAEAIAFSEKLAKDEVRYKNYQKVSLDKAALRAYVRLHAQVLELYEGLGPMPASEVRAFSALFPRQAQMLDNAKVDVDQYRDFLRVFENVVNRLDDGLQGVVNMHHIAELQFRFGLDGLTSFFTQAQYGFNASDRASVYFNFKLSPAVMEQAQREGYDVDILDYNNEATIFRFRRGVFQIRNHTGQVEFMGFSVHAMGIIAQDTVAKVPTIGPAIGQGGIATFLSRSDPTASKTNVSASLAGGQIVDGFPEGTRLPNGVSRMGLSVSAHPLAAMSAPHVNVMERLTGFVYGLGDIYYLPAYQTGGESDFIGGTPMSRTFRDALSMAELDIFPWMQPGQQEYRDIKGRPIPAAGLISERDILKYFANYQENGRRELFFRDHQFNEAKYALDVFDNYWADVADLGHQQMSPMQVRGPEGFLMLFMQAHSIHESSATKLPAWILNFIKHCQETYGLGNSHYKALKRVRVLKIMLNNAYLSVEQRMLAENSNARPPDRPRPPAPEPRTTGGGHDRSRIGNPARSPIGENGTHFDGLQLAIPSNAVGAGLASAPKENPAIENGQGVNGEIPPNPPFSKGGIAHNPKGAPFRGAQRTTHSAPRDSKSPLPLRERVRERGAELQSWGQRLFQIRGQLAELSGLPKGSAQYEALLAEIEHLMNDDDYLAQNLGELQPVGMKNLRGILKVIAKNTQVSLSTHDAAVDENGLPSSHDQFDPTRPTIPDPSARPPVRMPVGR